MCTMEETQVLRQLLPTSNWAKSLAKKLDPDNAGMVALAELIQEQEGITIDSMAQKILQNEPN